MVSTRSRSALQSGDGDGAAKGQPEVSSTPRRSSSRLAKASTPSGRAKPSKAASKIADLDAIAEESAQANAVSPGPLQQEAQARGGGSGCEPPEQQHAPAEEPAAAAGQPAKQQVAPPELHVPHQEATPVPDSHGDSGSEGGEHSGEGQGGEEVSSDQGRGSQAHALAGPGPSSGPPRLAADAGLLDKVVAEMFAALEGAYDSDSGGSSGGGGSSSGEEGHSESEGEEEQEEQRGPAGREQGDEGLEEDTGALKGGGREQREQRAGGWGASQGYVSCRRRSLGDHLSQPRCSWGGWLPCELLCSKAAPAAVAQGGLGGRDGAR
jgi:hypothetical protein